MWPNREEHCYYNEHGDHFVFNSEAEMMAHKNRGSMKAAEGKVIRRSVSRNWSSEDAPSQEKRRDFVTDDFGIGKHVWQWKVVIEGYEPLTFEGDTQEELMEKIATRLGMKKLEM